VNAENVDFAERVDRARPEAYALNGAFEVRQLLARSVGLELAALAPAKQRSSRQLFGVALAGFVDSVQPVGDIFGDRLPPFLSWVASLADRA
jgi:hypothetical protein